MSSTHTGAAAQLHVAGNDLDCNPRTKDANSELLCGFGMRPQEETRFGVYVASLTAKGPPEKRSMTREGDRLVQIDDYSPSVRDSPENIPSHVLGRPSTEATFSGVEDAPVSWRTRLPGGCASPASREEHEILPEKGTHGRVVGQVEPDKPSPHLMVWCLSGSSKPGDTSPLLQKSAAAGAAEVCAYARLTHPSTTGK